jgi:hypothetical protein
MFMLWLSVVTWTAHADVADEVASITDSNTRIVREMMPQIGVSSSAAEEARDAAIEDLRKSARTSPGTVRLFHLFFDEPQSFSDMLELSNTFVFIERITLKQFDPVLNAVWTTSINDFEAYTGSVEEKLAFLLNRQIFQHQAIASHGAPGGPTPPEDLDFSIYELQGYARNDEMNALVQGRITSLLHIKEVTRSITWDQIKAALLKSKKLDLPTPGSPQSSRSIQRNQSFLDRVFDVALSVVVGRAYAASFPPCGPGSTETYCPPDATYKPTTSNFQGWSYSLWGTPVNYVQSIVTWGTSTSQAAYKDASAPICRTPTLDQQLKTRCRTTTGALSSNTVYIEEGTSGTAIETKIRFDDPWCPLPIRSGNMTVDLLAGCMVVSSVSSTFPSHYQDFSGTDAGSDFVASTGTLAPHLIPMGQIQSSWMFFLKGSANSLLGLPVKHTLSINSDHFGWQSPATSIFEIDGLQMGSDKVWGPYYGPYPQPAWSFPP